MARSDDSKAGRKESAGYAHDEKMFKETPFGRRRTPGAAGSFFNRVAHFLGFPFYYVYNQLRTGKRSSAEKWFDDSGRHGNDPKPTPGKAGRGR